MRAALLILLALTPPQWWKETNSHATSAKAARAYEEKQYAAAAKAYERAQTLAPSARAAFNLGTAEIAAGQREQGSARMAEAIKDPALRADALFNRGNSALAAKALDHAVRDYIGALKANPRHTAAKRNLELALQKKKSQQQQQQGGSDGKQNQQNQQQQKPQPDPKKPSPQKEGNVDLEALLRSVQQQEQEELRRMRGRPAEGRVGW
ncbi:MAG TPA: hypothetical protein VEK57_31690 [Thermoanaerobaculia bacterium]|nr:hypothetical protein [Thermoanaerobaculia bacterium]